MCISCEIEVKKIMNNVTVSNCESQNHYFLTKQFFAGKMVVRSSKETLHSVLSRENKKSC